MLGITHFALGATGGTIINEKLQYDRLLIPVLSGIFAMLPDANKLLEIHTTKVVNQSVFNNIFWFHGLLDTMETTYPEIEGVIALCLLISVVIYTSDIV